MTQGMGVHPPAAPRDGPSFGVRDRPRAFRHQAEHQADGGSERRIGPQLEAKRRGYASGRFRCLRTPLIAS